MGTDVATVAHAVVGARERGVTASTAGGARSSLATATRARSPAGTWPECVDDDDARELAGGTMDPLVLRDLLLVDVVGQRFLAIGIPIGEPPARVVDHDDRALRPDVDAAEIVDVAESHHVRG